MAETSRNIREKINRYTPGITNHFTDHGYERINIMLMGLLGNGKSTLINSCMCVVKDEEYQNLSDSGNTDEGRTHNRRVYKLTDTIQIADNRGFAKLDEKEVLQVCAQLRYLRPPGRVEWSEVNLKETIRRIPESYERPVEFLLPVFVHSCRHTFPEDRSLGILVTKCYEITGIHPIVVITHSPPNLGAERQLEIENRIADLGIVHKVFLENYTERNRTRNQEADNQFLHFVDVCMEEAERAIKLRGNPDYCQVFATNVANQMEEELKLKEEQWEQEKMQKPQKKWCSSQ